VENKLPELRREHGLTQQQLADRVEVSRQTIISIEAGKFNPSVTLAFKLSNVFNKPIEDIFIYRGI
jgi:putative transcriptional regulator